MSASTLKKPNGKVSDVPKKHLSTSPSLQVSNKVSPVADVPMVADESKKAKIERESVQHVSAIPMPLSVNSTLENEMAYWIKHIGKIRKRTCISYVENTTKTDKRGALCHCGYLRSQHAPEYQNQTRERWDDNNTKVEPTDAFGEMLFVGYSSQRYAKYVRVDRNQKMKPVLQLMTSHWQLEAPDLIISVTGGAKNFHMKPRLKELFRRGLMKAAESTGAWIVTGGMHAGVMKHVGEAVRDYTAAQGNKSKVVALGIVPWGAVNNKEQLIDESLQGKWPASYKADLENQSRCSPLDPNHSHFILVDNGTQNVFGTEIEFRAKLEREVSLMQSQTGVYRAHGIPSVCVVLEGGPGTLKTVKTAIDSGTPAVIVQGSGRAADIIAFAYENSGEEKVEVIDKFSRKVQKTVSVVEDEVWERVRQSIVKEFGDKKVDNILVMVRECLKKRDHITVFRQDGTSSAKDIDVAILQALLKVSDDESVDQVRLALAWNQIEIAKTNIFGDDSNFKPKELYEVMHEAILNDKPDFIKLFMENGVDLREFLTVDRLTQLYNDVPQKELLHMLLLKERKERKDKYKEGMLFDLQDVANLIQTVMGDFYLPLYSRDSKYHNQSKAFDTSRLKTTDQSNSSWLHKYKDEDVISVYSQFFREQELEQNEPAFAEPARELFIWSVLMNRRDTAMLFWDEGREGIAAALVANKLLVGLANQANDSELERQLEENAQHFEEIAVGVLSVCHTSDEVTTHKMLVRELPLFGLSTIITLAVEADNKTFIAHAACQTLFTKIWMGKLMQDNSEFVLWTSVFFPPLIPLVVKFRNSMKANKAIEDVREKKASTNEKLFYTREETNLEAMNAFRAAEENKKKKEKKALTLLDKLFYFYKSPVITFRCNLMSYTAFLLIFAAVVLTDFHKHTVKPMEIFIIVYVISLVMEEARQLITNDSRGAWNKLNSHFTGPWNFLDLLALLMFISGEVLRFIDNDRCFTAARIILAFSFMVYSFRFLDIFSVHKELGPKVVMIGRMMIDMLYFLVILLVFVVSYGVAAHAILYPNSPLNIHLFQELMEKSYFQIYGNLYLEEIQGEVDCTNDEELWRNNTLPRCPESTAKWLVPILLGIYILIANVLMLNLLIAMFSYTFSTIQDNTDKHWAFQRYHLTRQYHDRPFLAPPIIVVMHVYAVIRRCAKCCCHITDTNDFRKTFDESEVRQVVIWENLNASEYLLQREAENQGVIDNQVKLANQKVDAMSMQVEDIVENSFVMQNSEKASSAIKLPPVLEDRLDFIEQQLQRTSEAIDWLVAATIANGTKMEKKELKSVQQIRQEAKEKKEKEIKEKKEKIKEMLQQQLLLHQKSRDISYPSRKGDLHYRCEVSDDMVPWKTDFKEYRPTYFTDPNVLQEFEKGNKLVDPDLIPLPVAEREALMTYNDYDIRHGAERRTFVENDHKVQKYTVVDGLPRNPSGRTGMCGRGTLYRWGPNHASDPIITRWKRNQVTGELVKESGKKQLEFLSVQRTDNKEWAIPGGFRRDHNKGSIHDALKVEFEEEVLGKPQPGPTKDEKLNQLWATGREVFRGYADDHRNTDNAWIETMAMNYHDEDGTLTRNFKLKAGEGAENVGWREISSRQHLYGVHLALLHKVATLHSAAF